MILRESGSVRRAEDLARKIRAQTGNKPRDKADKRSPHIVSDETDLLRQKLEDSLGGHPANSVRLSRSRAETRLTIVLKGNPEETESRLQRICKGITG